MKIFCIGDSLALPGHNNSYEDTWFCLLKKAFPENDIISFFQRALTTNILHEPGGGEGKPGSFPAGADLLEHYMPGVVIMQLGIVDCAPRYISRGSVTAKIIGRSPAFFQTIFYSLIKMMRRRSSKYADVPPERFMSNMERFLQRCSNAGVLQVIVIDICTPGIHMLEKNPGIMESTKQYNAIMHSMQSKFPILHFIDPLNAGRHGDTIFEDGYHPNPAGNHIVFEEIAKVLCHG